MFQLHNDDCHFVLKSMDDNSVDSIVTDPPYFLINSSNAGFMGKKWDSLSVENAVVEIFIKSMRLDLSTEEESIAQSHVVETSERIINQNSIVQFAENHSSDLSHKSNQNINSAQMNALTKEEALVLCKELFPSLISHVEKLPETVKFVIPNLFTDHTDRSAAQNAVDIWLENPKWKDLIISFTKTGSRIYTEGTIEIPNGIGLDQRSIKGMAGNVEIVGLNVSQELKISNVTTSSPIEFQKIITKITSLHFVRNAIKRFTKTREFILILLRSWHERWGREVLRVLKPGGHALVFGGPRSSHHLVAGLEAAGFEVRDSIQWIFGTGFPKSHSISKSIEKELDLESADQWNGWGTALKPSHEPIALIRKPLSEKTVAKNVLRWGVGGINIDAGKIGFSDNRRPQKSFCHTGKITGKITGRFPSNTLFSHHEDCEQVGIKEVKSDSHSSYKRKGGLFIDGLGNLPDQGNIYGKDGKETVPDWRCSELCPVRELDAQSGVNCGAAAPVRRKSTPNTTNKNNYKKHSNVGDDGASFRADKGGASRFFATFQYFPKASKRDRNSGLEGMEEKRSEYGPNDDSNRNTIRERLHNSIPKLNHHPTVKSIKLMEYLIKLITPPHGLVLDPFMGSGSTGVAALRLGFDFVGIEKELEYYEIAKRRIENVNGRFDL